jgi:hypothetical protein
MMKTFSKDELQALAELDFETHGVSELHATTDGQIFIKKHFAEQHAGDKGTVYTFQKAATQTDDAPKPMSVKDLSTLVATLEDKAVLTEMLNAENAGAKRATAIKAIEDRISKLSE